MQNLGELTRRLICSQVEFVLVGGFAAVAHGVTQVKRDVDICRRFCEENLMRIQKAFEDLHPTPRSHPDLPLHLTSELCASLKNLYLKTDLGVVDCLGDVLGVGNFEEVLQQSVEAVLPYGKCKIICIDALIRAQQAMKGNHDKMTVMFLKKIKEQQT